MSTVKHTPGTLVAFTEAVTEKITGFEICTCMETDEQHHPKLLAIAKKYEDALLYAASPALLKLLAELARAGNASTRKVWLGMSKEWRAEVRSAIAAARGGA